MSDGRVLFSDEITFFSGAVYNFGTDLQNRSNLGSIDSRREKGGCSQPTFTNYWNPLKRQGLKVPS